MLKAQPGSAWALQAWQSNPDKKMLDGTIKENTLILELFAEAYPQWKNREGFYGHPWVWNIISNFGGNTGMHGALWKVAQHPVEALNAPNRGNLAGIGAMMEASEQDAVLWDLLFDMAWRDTSPDLGKWISDYATRRYGKSTPDMQKAWNILLNTAYAPKGPDSEPESPFCMRPSFSIGSTYGRVKREYDVCEFAKAWELLIKDSGNYRGVDPFEHDLIDVSRQAVANLALTYTDGMAKAFNNKNKVDFEKNAAAFLDLLMDQDRMLETDTHFRLGKWIADARALVSSPVERDLFEWNGRTQITVWGPRATADSLHEYAHREWSGLLRDFYYMRWKMFADNVLANWDTYTKKKKTGKDAFNTAVNNIAGGGKEGDPTGIDWFAVEEAWTRQLETYPATPRGDRIGEAKRMYDKHFPEVKAACGW
jgi:alpha-N-acetylglucosaminidase